MCQSRVDRKQNISKKNKEEAEKCTANRFNKINDQQIDISVFSLKKKKKKHFKLFQLLDLNENAALKSYFTVIVIPVFKKNKQL